MRTQKMVIASLLGLAMIGGAPVMAHAQQKDPGNVTLDLDQVDVREALRALFRSTGYSYSIAPDVQGVVTLNLHNVAFETALQNILKQVDATYRLEAGVYTVIKREPPIQAPPQEQQPSVGGNNHERRKVFVRSADPMFLATILGSDKGNQNFTLAPEMSTVLKGGSAQGGNGGFGNNGFGGGQSGFGNGNGSGRGNGNRGGGNRGGGGNGVGG